MNGGEVSRCYEEEEEEEEGLLNTFLFRSVRAMVVVEFEYPAEAL
jgi:hypothetical protein